MGERTTVGDLPAHLAVPSGEGPWPGMVLVHEAFGLDAVMVRAAERVAEMGYVVLAPDLVARGRRPVCLAQTFAALRRGRRSGVRRHRGRPGRAAGRPAMLGVGGRHRVLPGRRLRARPRRSSGWDAAVVNYGMLPDDPSVLDGSCPVVASYGARDRFLAGSAARLEEAFD